MDFIKVLREDNGLSDLLCDACDVHIAVQVHCLTAECRFS